MGLPRYPLANLSSAGATIDFLEKTFLVTERAERPFGWPLAWYWRMGGVPPGASQWPVSRLSATRLVGNVAIWLAILVTEAPESGACLPRRMAYRREQSG